MSWQILAVIRVGEGKHQAATSCKRMVGMGRLEGATVSYQKETQLAIGEWLP